MKNEAILLLGPTGAGKTPLGDGLAERPLFGRRCIHFDFGAQLRQAAEHGCNGLSPNDIATVRNVLMGGALLEDDTFHIAHTILKVFMEEQNAGVHDIIVLNGLPRHTGQARDVDGILSVILVVVLECTAEITCARIAQNSGGDRTERTDDSLAEIERKLEIYAGRTRHLLEHYRNEGVPCFLVPIGVETTSADMLDILKQAGAGFELQHAGQR